MLYGVTAAPLRDHSYEKGRLISIITINTKGVTTMATELINMIHNVDPKAVITELPSGMVNIATTPDKVTDVELVIMNNTHLV